MPMQIFIKNSPEIQDNVKKEVKMTGIVADFGKD